MRVTPFAFRYQGNGATPCQYIDTGHSKGNWLRYNFATGNFHIMKLCSRLFVVYCRKCLKDNKLRYLISILRWHRTLVDGSLESPCRLLVKCNWTSFTISYRWVATRQNVSNLAAFRRGWLGHFEPRFQGERVIPGNIFWFLENYR